MAKIRLTPEELARCHDGMCGVSIGDGPCSCLVLWVEELQKESDAKKIQIDELLMALGRAHDPGRCPYNSYGKCWACVALKKYGDQTPDQHLAICSVCKELIEDTFAARKAAWCEKCEGYSHNNCWPAHNLTYCTAAVKRKEMP